MLNACYTLDNNNFLSNYQFKMYKNESNFKTKQGLKL